MLAAAAPGSFRARVTAFIVCAVRNSYWIQACWPAGALGSWVAFTKSPSVSKVKSRVPPLEVILGSNEDTETSLAAARKAITEVSA